MKIKLGIPVNTNKRLDDVLGLTNAAFSKGHEAAIFTMDEGTKLLEQPFYSGLCTLQGVTMSFCDHGVQRLGATTDGLPKETTCGSQSQYDMPL